MALYQRRRTIRAGMTLVELLLVLALLVVVGSLAAPVVTSSFASVRLRRAGDLVITHWAHARARAIETGVPCQFRFTPESGRARLEPWSVVAVDPALASQASTNLAASAGAAAGVSDDATDDNPIVDADLGDPAAMPVVNVRLPGRVTFYGGESRVDDPLTRERRVDPLTGAGGQWSAPIRFFPDGSTSDASVVLANDRRQYLRVTLRGLTGTARASAVLTREELDRAGR